MIDRHKDAEEVDDGIDGSDVYGILHAPIPLQLVHRCGHEPGCVRYCCRIRDRVVDGKLDRKMDALDIGGQPAAGLVHADRVVPCPVLNVGQRRVVELDDNIAVGDAMEGSRALRGQVVSAVVSVDLDAFEGFRDLPDHIVHV